MLLVGGGCHGRRYQCPVESRLQPGLALRQNGGELGQQPTLPPSHPSSWGAVEPTLGETGIEALNLMGKFLHPPRFAVREPLVRMSDVRTVFAPQLSVGHGVQVSALSAAQWAHEQPH
ncbi:MAG: hypothetical protein WCG85_22580 [Polyangia bacterium]